MRKSAAVFGFGGDGPARGKSLAERRHQVRHAARHSTFVPFGDDSDQSRMFSASRSMRLSGSPALMASERHSTGKVQSGERRDARRLSFLLSS
jgi:hypothetical protein